MPETTRIPPEAEPTKDAMKQALGRVELDAGQDRHARAALEAYADSAAAEMPWLAEWLRTALPGAGAGFTYCAATVERVFGDARAWAALQPGFAPDAWARVQTQLEDMLRVRQAPADPQE